MSNSRRSNLKRKVFISVIDEEKAIAIALKELLENSFLGMVDVFVAFDGRSLPAGKQWMNEVTSALKECVVELLLASPTSVKAQWINFEAGCGWIRDIPVIPICHGGLAPDKLPRPLADLQSPRSLSDEDLKVIIEVIAGQLGCEVPSCDFSSFRKAVESQELLERLFVDMALAEDSPLAKTSGLAPHEIASLITIADDEDVLSRPISMFVVHRRMKQLGFTSAAVNLAVRRLLQLKYIVKETGQDDFNSYEGYQLTDLAWNWIHSNQESVRLRTDSKTQEVDF